ncbi:MAG TPA: hypothetical protein VL284_15555 [Thermoanaerobaculia bacterium]|nr:hypothetical protein [Thermoanaerobaculia bacterium]
MRTPLLAIFLLGFAAIASAQQDAILPLNTLRIGNVTNTTPDRSDMGIGSVVHTDIDLNTPATGTGTISNVYLYWNGDTCPNVAKIKFFRRSVDQLTMFAERGPFNLSGSGVIALTLTPAVSVQQGDLIGITQLTQCGSPRGWSPGSKTNGYVEYPGDVTGAVGVDAQWKSNDELALWGTGIGTELTSWAIPVVGSTQGGFGSYFKTALQLFNPTNKTISGRLVYHKGGASGTPSDPSLNYTVAAGQVQSHADIVAEMGITGIGSLDAITPSNVACPIVVARIYNDAGAEGTSGFTLDVMDMEGQDERLLSINEVAYLVTPADPSKMRFNIGIKTYFDGATIDAEIRDSSGAHRSSMQKKYPPHYFEQVDAATFFDVALHGSESIVLTIDSGSAVIYGSSTDNTTNDSAIQFAKPAP